MLEDPIQRTHALKFESHAKNVPDISRLRRFRYRWSPSRSSPNRVAHRVLHEVEVPHWTSCRCCRTAAIRHTLSASEALGSRLGSRRWSQDRRAHLSTTATIKKVVDNRKKAPTEGMYAAGWKYDCIGA